MRRHCSPLAELRGLLAGERDAGILAHVDVASGIGDRIERRQDEVEIGHTDHTAQVVAHLPDVGLRKGRIDVHVAAAQLEDPAVERQLQTALHAIEKSVLVEMDDRTERLGRRLVHVEQSDSRKIA